MSTGNCALSRGSWGVFSPSVSTRFGRGITSGVAIPPPPPPVLTQSWSSPSSGSADFFRSPTRSSGHLFSPPPFTPGRQADLVDPLYRTIRLPSKTVFEHPVPRHRGQPRITRPPLATPDPFKPQPAPGCPAYYRVAPRQASPCPASQLQHAAILSSRSPTPLAPTLSSPSVAPQKAPMSPGTFIRFIHSAVHGHGLSVDEAYALLDEAEIPAVCKVLPAFSPEVIPSSASPGQSQRSSLPPVPVAAASSNADTTDSLVQPQPRLKAFTLAYEWDRAVAAHGGLIPTLDGAWRKPYPANLLSSEDLAWQDRMHSFVTTGHRSHAFSLASKIDEFDAAMRPSPPRPVRVVRVRRRAVPPSAPAPKPKSVSPLVPTKASTITLPTSPTSPGFADIAFVRSSAPSPSLAASSSPSLTELPLSETSSPEPEPETAPAGFFSRCRQAVSSAFSSAMTWLRGLF